LVLAKMKSQKLRALFTLTFGIFEIFRSAQIQD
jgi:hypothetical protein